MSFERSELAVRVYYEDTDFSGRVYHASYLRFLERGRTEWLRGQGMTHQDLAATSGIVFAVRSMQIDFLGPARIDDLLSVETHAAMARGASMEFRSESFSARRRSSPQPCWSLRYGTDARRGCPSRSDRRSPMRKAKGAENWRGTRCDPSCARKSDAVQASRDLIGMQALGLGPTLLRQRSSTASALSAAAAERARARRRASRTDVPKIVDWCMAGKIEIDPMITHTADPRRDQRGVRPDARGQVDPERAWCARGRTDIRRPLGSGDWRVASIP